MAWLFSGVFVVAAVLASAVEPYSATHPAVYAGTYAVRICHGSCTGPSAIPFRTGTIVLFEQPLLDQQGRTFRDPLRRDPDNACFVLKHVGTRSAEGDYVPAAQGFFSWALREHTVELELTRSPDGGYGASLHLTPEGLGGTGAIWGGVPPARPMTPDSPRLPPDNLSAIRMGEPDIAKCPPLSDDNR
ncbi:MAG: hypothetical protein ABI129_04785 [Rhodanobacter sp.]